MADLSYRQIDLFVVCDRTHRPNRRDSALYEFEDRAYHPPAMPFRIPPSQLRQIDARRICLIKPSALGDVVQTLPLLGMLRQRFPAATISWVIRRDLADLLTGHPDLTEVIPYHRDGGWREWRHLLAVLRQRRFDLVFDLQGLLRTAVMTFATGARFRVGLDTAREGSSLACNCIVPNSGRDVPAHTRYGRVAMELGIPCPTIEAVISTEPRDEAWLTAQVCKLPRPLMAVHTGAGWETKRWPVEKFAEVAKRFEGSVVAVGAESEQLAAARIVDTVHGCGRAALNLAGRTTLKQLAALLRAADVMVSNDSGPMHLAAAVGTPVVGIFTCTSPILSGPPLSGSRGARHELVSTGIPCAASYYKYCPLADSAHLGCMRELSVERVWSAVSRILDRQHPIRRPA
jgi:lipopolysaccharide heptosyltransferase II